MLTAIYIKRVIKLYITLKFYKVCKNDERNALDGKEAEGAAHTLQKVRQKFLPQKA